VEIKDFRAGSLSFYANTTDPTVPASLGVIGIVGLNDLEGPRLNSQSAARPAAAPATPDPAMDINSTSPSDLWSIYDQPAENKGDGQSMAIFGWGTTKNTEADLRGFEREFKLPGVPLTINYYPKAGAAPTDSGGEVEWALDTQASSGMAPNAKNLTMYMAREGSDAHLLAAYNAWAGDKNGALQGSSSFSGCEEAPGTDGLSGTPGSPSGVLIAGEPNQDLYEKVLSKLVAEGRTMFASTGDTGAGCPAVSLVLNGVTLVPTPMLGYPAVSPNAVGVGGTVLYFNDASTTPPTSPASRALEYGWTHGGGGFSEFIAAPAYQKTNPPILTPCVTDPHGTPYPGAPPTCRGIPDVSAQSGDIVSNGYNITVGGVNDSGGGGTSLSSPLWLGMWTRIQAASTKKGGNGFANPAIYRVANDPAKYAKDFFDVGGASADTVITCNGATPLNCSHPGWDYLTGWGTPNIKNLMLDLDGRTQPVAKTTLRPPPALPVDTHGGTTCPGPQVKDAVGDAPNDYPGGDGSNMDNLDIVKVAFASPNASTLRMTMTIKDLQPPGPPVAELSALWSVYWTYGNTAYNATATVNGAVWDFSDSAGNAITGAAVMGPNGTITMDVPLADTGNPPAGAKVTETFADARGSFTVAGNGLRYTAAADRAPDSGNGAPWIIGKHC
jgi:subtilase family serine protease